MQACRAEDVQDWGGGAEPHTLHWGRAARHAAAAQLGIM